MNTVSAATHSPLRFVSGWRVQTRNWLGIEQIRQCANCTRVLLVRASQGAEPDQRYWLYALEPATANQLRMVELYLAEHIIEIETWHTNEPAHALNTYALADCSQAEKWLRSEVNGPPLDSH